MNAGIQCDSELGNFFIPHIVLFQTYFSVCLRKHKWSMVLFVCSFLLILSFLHQMCFYSVLLQCWSVFTCVSLIVCPDNRAYQPCFPTSAALFTVTCDKFLECFGCWIFVVFVVVIPILLTFQKVLIE